MLFNSIEFLVFFGAVVVVYFILPHRGRLIFLLLASYFFYMSWKVEYALLIIVSTLVDYVAALRMGRYADRSRRRPFLILSLGVNLGLLLVFKYANFFSESVQSGLAIVDLTLHMPSLNLLLPVGISFYTFQTLSYSLDVYRGDRAPETNLLAFALFVSFFPQLVAGPIERSSRLIPQFLTPTRVNWERISSGLALILWGFFIKLVIADQLAPYVDRVYGSPQAYTGGHFILASYFFAFQIFGDFAGYSSIAIGTAKILGINLMQNFRRPYFSASISEFWTRWHISLSQWFRDYLYVPLGGNRRGYWRTLANVAAVFAISGLWHGANWTFVAWGLVHGSFVVTQRVVQRRPNSSKPAAHSRLTNWLFHGAKVLITFHLVVFAWIFFRADSMDDAWYIVTHLTNLPAFSLGYAAELILPFSGNYSAAAIFLCCGFFIAVMETVHLVQEVGHPTIHRWWQHSNAFRAACLIALTNIILLFGNFNSQTFIYFQF